MIVSHEHRFVFLKTRRTAGTSIEVALSRALEGGAIVTPVTPAEPGHSPRNHGIGRVVGPSLLRLVREAEIDPDRESIERIPYFNHMPAWLLREKLGRDAWQSYFKFCFERNPWEKVASIYMWRFRRDSGPPPFEEWLLGDSGISGDWPIYSIDDAPAVDAIGRYETLQADLDECLRRIGISGGRIRLPHAKKSRPDRGPRYSPRAADHVRRVFHREIELLGYECPPELLT